MNIQDRINELLMKKNRVIIAIDGPCASGKSTLADELAKTFNGIVFHMDDFFLPIELKTKDRLSEIGGNVHYERFEEEVLQKLNNVKLSYQKYNCQIEELEDTQTVDLPRVIIIEGSYSLRKDLRDYYDVKVLLQIDSKLQVSRLKSRNERLLPRFINEWIPLENRYFNHEKLELLKDVFIISSK